jgi:snurportin-1
MFINKFSGFPNQVVLELQEDGKLATCDDPPMAFGCLDGSFILQVCLEEVSIQL